MSRVGFDWRDSDWSIQAYHLFSSFFRGWRLPGGEFLRTAFASWMWMWMRVIQRFWVCLDGLIYKYKESRFQRTKYLNSRLNGGMENVRGNLSVKLPQRFGSGGRRFFLKSDKVGQRLGDLAQILQFFIKKEAAMAIGERDASESKRRRKKRKSE